MAWLKISTSTELVRFRTDDIVFIHADGNYSDVYLPNGKSRKLTFKLHYLDEALQRIESKKFVRVGKSLVVNKDFVSRSDRVKDYCDERSGSFFRQFVLLSGGVVPSHFQLHGKVVGIGDPENHPDKSHQRFVPWIVFRQR